MNIQYLSIVRYPFLLKQQLAGRVLALTGSVSRPTIQLPVNSYHIILRFFTSMILPSNILSQLAVFIYAMYKLISQKLAYRCVHFILVNAKVITTITNQVYFAPSSQWLYRWKIKLAQMPHARVNLNAILSSKFMRLVGRLCSTP